jgi:hypothetical protein
VLRLVLVKDLNEVLRGPRLRKGFGQLLLAGVKNAERRQKFVRSSWLVAERDNRNQRLAAVGDENNLLPQHIKRNVVQTVYSRNKP